VYAPVYVAPTGHGKAIFHPPPLGVETSGDGWFPLAQAGLDEKQAGSYVLQVASEPEARAPRV